MIRSYLTIYVFLLCNREFDAQTWRSDHQPTQKQLDNMRQSGASNLHPDLRQLSYGYITVRRYGRYDVNGFRFRSTIFEDARPPAVTCNTGAVVRAVDDEGQETNYHGVIKDTLELTFGGDKDLRVVFFYCYWFDPTHGTRVKKIWHG
jgi:hypothetical protein